MNFGWVTVLLVAVAATSAVLVPHVGENPGLYLIGIPLFLCVLFAWLLVFKNGGMRQTRTLLGFLFFGLLTPVASNWAKPLPLSFSAFVCLLSGSVMLGAILRMLWMVYA